MSSALLERVQVEYLLAETEAELILAEADAGLSVTNAIRPLNKAERKAKVRFGEIEKSESEAAEKAARIIDEIGQLYIIAIIGEVFGRSQAIDSAGLAAKLTSINVLIPHAAKDSMRKAAAELARIFADSHSAGSEIVIGEARRQGVTGLPAPLTGDPEKFLPLGQAVALAPWTRLTARLQADYLNPAKLILADLTAADFHNAAGKISLDGSHDLARQSIHTAHGTGRIATAEKLGPTEVYSSELMDGATCGPCSRVDGKDYDDLVEAKTEYETGGYGACEGGARCRGTLVFIYPPGHKPDLPELEPLDPPPAPAPAPAVVTPAPAPVPAEPAAPLVPLPKRPKGTSQRYTDLSQLPAPSPDVANMTRAEHVQATNPGYASGSRNYSNNCTSVVTAYEFRRRGYDVTAAPVKGGQGRYEREYIDAWWTRPDGTPAQSINVRNLPPVNATHDAEGRKILPGGSIEARLKMEQALMTYPDGARGSISLNWAKSGGHTFSWEKVGGKIYYLEAQIGQVDASGHVGPGKFKPGTLTFVRLDDKTPRPGVVEALETRPETMAAEIAAKEAAAAKRKADPNRKPTAAEMRAESSARSRKNAEGKNVYIPAKYRKPWGGKWEPIPEADQQRAKENYLKFIREHGNIDEWEV